MSTTRRLNVEVVGSASSFIAMMNRVTSGVTRFGSGLGTMNRNAQQSNRFLQAMSTTLRYAFAGRVIFGIQNAVRNLGDFKSQLGEIDALASRLGADGKIQGLGSQLGDVGKEALLMSNRFGVAVGEVESYMQRFYTSFKPTGSISQQTSEMQKFVNAHLELVTMLGSRAGDPNALAGGLAGLIKAMPGGEKNAGASAQVLSNYFARIVATSPNLSGQDIATAAGRLSSAKTLSAMSIKDVLAVYGLAAQTGGSSAVITRGVTQLLGQSLLHPTRPASLRVYQAAGLPTSPNALAERGGLDVMNTLLNYVSRRKANGASKTDLDSIYNAFSRQESVRQFVNLLVNGGVDGLKKFSKGLDDAAKSNFASQAAKKRLDQSTLLRMRFASQNLGISLVSGADWPLEHLLADPLIAASNAAIRHPAITQGIVGGALSIGAANALRRLGAFGRFGKFGKALGTASGIEQAAVGGIVGKEELPAAISGGATDGTRANPFWVIISPLSWQMGGPMGGGNPGGGGGSPFAFFKKLPKVVPIGAVGALGPVGLVAGSAGVAGYYSYKDLTVQGLGNVSKWGSLRKRGFTQKDILTMLHEVPSAYRSPLIKALEASHVSRDNVVRVVFEGNPKADLTVKLVDSHGRALSVQEHNGVPIVPKAKQFPTSQGKAGSRKASKQT